MKRTKCSKLITQVIAPSLFNEMKADLHDECYLLIADESTDASSNKNLCVLARYFSKSKKKVETSLLGMAEVVSATGENLFEALKSLTDRTHLQLENCI